MATLGIYLESNFMELEECTGKGGMNLKGQNKKNQVK